MHVAPRKRRVHPPKSRPYHEKCGRFSSSRKKDGIGLAGSGCGKMSHIIKPTIRHAPLDRVSTGDPLRRVSVSYKKAELAPTFLLDLQSGKRTRRI